MTPAGPRNPPEPDDLDFGDGDGDAPIPGVIDDSSEDPVLEAPLQDAPIAGISDDAVTLDLSGLDPDVTAEGDLAVLDWAAEAVLIEVGVRLPVLLDTGSATSSWHTDRSDTPPELTVAIGAVRGVVRLSVVPSQDERLVLGRDFLADRVLVRS